MPSNIFWNSYFFRIQHLLLLLYYSQTCHLILVHLFPHYLFNDAVKIFIPVIIKIGGRLFTIFVNMMIFILYVTYFVNTWIFLYLFHTLWNKYFKYLTNDRFLSQSFDQYQVNRDTTTSLTHTTYWCIHSPRTSTAILNLVGTCFTVTLSLRYVCENIINKLTSIMGLLDIPEFFTRFSIGPCFGIGSLQLGRLKKSIIITQMP